MKEIKDVEILDILPYTFKTSKYKALSAAIKALTALFYSVMSSVLFWADIENADAVTLDAMAAELDAPFYSSDMSDEKKRSVIAAAFAYNSRVGTRSSVEALLNAAFGGGKLSEWYDYGGLPYHFKVDLPQEEGVRPRFDDFSYFYNNITIFKNARAKLDGITIEMKTGAQELKFISATTIEQNSKIGVQSIPNDMVSEAEYYKTSGIVIETYKKIPPRRYMTYETLKNKTYGELKAKTYGQIINEEV